jgi:hypothetical protein
MPGQSRKIQYKSIKATASEHVGQKGEVWYDANTTALRFYNGDPGGEVLSAGGSTGEYLDYGSLPTNQNRAIDLTYTNHWIVNLDSDSYHYTLADGVNGQELVFFASAGLIPQDGSADFFVDNVKYWDDGAAQWASGARIFRLFRSPDATNAEGMIKSVFLNGCWNFQGTFIVDEGGWP